MFSLFANMQSCRYYSNGRRESAGLYPIFLAVNSKPRSMYPLNIVSGREPTGNYLYEGTLDAQTLRENSVYEFKTIIKIVTATLLNNNNITLEGNTLELEHLYLWLINPYGYLPR